MDNTVLVCPECGGDQVTTQHHQMFMVNTGEHWRHNVKTQDPDSLADCLDCDWQGKRKDLKEQDE
jgi:hypothetical protein